MSSLVCVAIGGSLGAVARYVVSGILLHRYSGHQFPLATFCVNILGCFMIGLAMALATKYHLLGQEARLLFVTGFLGSFTTFSAFGFETVYLLKRGEVLLAGGNVVLSVLLGILAVFLGSRI